jgi:DNA-binding HxlR family transcriptional regulator
MPAKHLTLDERTTYRRLEDVVGCKWSAAVVGALRRGVSRPGQLERYIPGISTKILNERLRKLVDYGLATRVDRSAAVLHVEYQLTPTGTKLAGVIEQLHALQQEHTALQESQPPGKPRRARAQRASDARSSLDPQDRSRSRSGK